MRQQQSLTRGRPVMLTLALITISARADFEVERAIDPILFGSVNVSEPLSHCEEISCLKLKVEGNVKECVRRSMMLS
jgi:hypothetical protein